MAEDIIIIRGTKEEQYKSLLPQIAALIEGEENVIANLANITAALKDQFNWWWVGFYLVEGEELVLGPFQGPVACTRIKKGRGVCGTAWEKAETLVVPDVSRFPGQISCSSYSKSEIVVPVFHENEVRAVLDVDSEYLNYFDETDSIYLNKITEHLKFQSIFTKRFLIKGKVQGVYFRQSALQVAKSLGVKGYVQNLTEGNAVEAVVTGNASQLNEFYNWCLTGPPTASVSSVMVSELSLQKFENFSII